MREIASVFSTDDDLYFGLCRQYSYPHHAPTLSSEDHHPRNQVSEIETDQLSKKKKFQHYFTILQVSLTGFDKNLNSNYN